MREFKVQRVHVKGFTTERCDNTECHAAHSYEVSETRRLEGQPIEVFYGIHGTEEQAHNMIRQVRSGIERPH